jgi:peptidoglycan biosynthesis protein MviN/MurJ (putative lipid II flippase)
VLNLILVWPLAEAGLAVSTSVAAVVQLALLIAVVSRRDVPLDWKRLAGTGLRTIVAAAAMAIVGYAVLHLIPAPLALGGKLAQVFAPFAACVLVYLAVHAVLGGGDLRMAMGKLHEPQ